MKELQLSAEDNVWKFQEALAHADNMLALEKATTSELRAKVDELQGKLTEVEMYVDSDRGSVALQLEESLAAAKLRIVELEAEKDSADFHATKAMQTRSLDSKENRRVNWSGTFE